MEQINVVKPKWAFYLSITFDLEKINKNFNFSSTNKKIEEIISEKVSNTKRFDVKFCYYLLAETWVCSVPLSSFNSSFDGFRITLLEDDLEKYKNTLNIIKNFIKTIND
jgi:aspartate/methionine/tyrosine aminotransferase